MNEREVAIHQAASELDRVRRLTERAIRQYDRAPDGSADKQHARDRLDDLSADRMRAEAQLDRLLNDDEGEADVFGND